MSTRPRLFPDALDLTSSLSAECAGLSFGPGGKPSPVNPANGVCSKLGLPAGGMRLLSLIRFRQEQGIGLRCGGTDGKSLPQHHRFGVSCEVAFFSALAASTPFRSNMWKFCREAI